MNGGSSVRPPPAGLRAALARGGLAGRLACAAGGLAGRAGRSLGGRLARARLARGCLARRRLTCRRLTCARLACAAALLRGRRLACPRRRALLRRTTALRRRTLARPSALLRCGAPRARSGNVKSLFYFLSSSAKVGDHSPGQLLRASTCVASAALEVRQCFRNVLAQALRTKEGCEIVTAVFRHPRNLTVQRGRCSFFCSCPCLVRRRADDERELRTVVHGAGGQPRALEVLPVERRRLHVLVEPRRTRRIDRELALAANVHDRVRERRARQFPRLRARGRVVDAERREHVPSAHRAGVVVARHAVGTRAVDRHRLPRLALRLPRPSEPVVVPRRPEIGFVARGELVADVVHAEEAALVLHGRGCAEEVVEPLARAVVATKRLHEPAHVVRDEPQVLVSGALLPAVLELRPPDAWHPERVRARPAPVLVARTQETIVCAPEVAPVPGTLLERRHLLSRAERAQRREHRGVVDRVLECERAAAAPLLVLADPAALHVTLETLAR